VDARDPQLLDAGVDDGPVHDDADGSVAEGPTDTTRVLDDVAPTGVRRGRRRRSAARNAVEWVAVLVGALAVALVVKTWLFQAFYIPSESMLPTLSVGDRVLVNKVDYDIGDVRRGHIIVFERPESWTTGDIDDLIKRVIGLPGDTISARDGQVFVNGEPLDEPWLAEQDRGLTRFDASSGCEPACTLGPDELFVLGDNRDNSSASNVYGPIDFDVVVGRAFLRVWPLGEFGGI
jgi:signal peptidase I